MSRERKRRALRWKVMDDDDDSDINAVAQEFVERLGRAAVDELNERAEIAEGIGDKETARTWRELARAAESLIT